MSYKTLISLMMTLVIMVAGYSIVQAENPMPCPFMKAAQQQMLAKGEHHPCCNKPDCADCSKCKKAENCCDDPKCCEEAPCCEKEGAVKKTE